jgi:glyoxylase-like metal-dependent hydrolase (beta-lactamase superfamily II)
MTTHHLINRRVAIKEMGKAGLAIVVFGTAACSDSPEATTTTLTPDSTSMPPSPTTTATTPTTLAGTTTIGPTETTAFHRVDLSFVSAYILYRSGEAALVDTGIEGSADAIETSLGQVGLGWDSVGHVILTHKHPDHVGSLDMIIERAPTAEVYAGAADIPAIVSTVPPTAIGDGGSVFDLEIIGTPGHTAGHISVLDSVAGILVAGDALNGSDGGVTGPDPGFSEDMTIAVASVRKLATFDYEVALFGHGDPVLESASAAVADLATGLG